MIKRLTKHGNSLALVIDRSVLDLLDISADTPLSLTTDGKCLVVAPVRDAKKSGIKSHPESRKAISTPATVSTHADRADPRRTALCRQHAADRTQGEEGTALLLGRTLKRRQPSLG